jgi:hypothetical protein
VRRKLALLAAAAALLAAAAAGCGFGAGERDRGEATITVTRDFGRKLMHEITVTDPTESETVMRALDRETELETRYGGGFVQAIDGVAGGRTGGRTHDWFYFVNGIEASVGAADNPLRAGDRVWWDHRDWTTAMRVPAVVGSFPEPFRQAAAEEPDPVTVECEAERALCERAVQALADAGLEEAGVPIRVGSLGSARKAGPRLAVGEWERLRRDRTLALLAEVPADSGVFARFVRRGDGWALEALDERGEPSGAVPADAGLVAALRWGEEPASWVATGTTTEAVAAAVALLDEEALRSRYAVAAPGEGAVALPLEPQEGPG